MSPAGSEPAGSPWRLRRARAVHLLDKTPHAEELLAFYVGMLELQARVAAGLLVDRWASVAEAGEGAPALLAVERVPVDELLADFAGFLERVAEIGTEVTTAGALDLLEAGEGARAEALRTVLADLAEAPRAAGEIADPKDASPTPAGFHARAFLEPVLTTLARALGPTPPEKGRRRCFVCGAPPQVSALRDLPGALGARSLTCSLCATEWRFPRLTCLNCGETDAGRLRVHTAESVPHVRVDACGSCNRYLMSVDLRLDGAAVPLVDEVAAVALDLWAGSEGLSKIRRNILGL